jgi:hypothetical protein
MSSEFQQETHRMAIPSNGVAPEVIRGIMPPYQLRAAVLRATFAALPAPPPDASAAWREARIGRLIQKILACKPVDAGATLLWHKSDTQGSG